MAQGMVCQSRRSRWLVGITLAIGLTRSVAAEDILPVGLFNDELPAIFPAVLAEPTDEAKSTDGAVNPSPPQPPSTAPPLPLDIGNEPVKTQAFQAPVTSLTLTPSTVGKTPAAVFVIDQEMIRRSGALTLPEVLRMVPGVHVGMGNVGEPNVSIRGQIDSNFPAVFSTSARVLVLIDGRSIYDPVVGGVLWSPNDVVLQDIERIEVIRGPGATVWGANAVNGVINIITKSAADTQGTLVQGLGGTEYKTVAVARVGTQTTQNSHIRIFGKFRDFDAGKPILADAPENDGFHDFRGGFRWDYGDRDADKVTLQGNMFNAPRGPNSYLPGFPTMLASQPDYEWFGGNAQASWTHSFDNDTQLKLMGIYDRLNYANSALEFGRDSYILDAAYTGTWGDRHKWLLGGQVRTDADAITGLQYTIATTPFDPAAKTYTVTSVLVQDEIELIPDSLSFLAGTKMEVNAFTGFEIQPSGRLLKTIDDKRVTWAAVSRAIRRPNRIDDGSEATAVLYPPSVFSPNKQLKADAGQLHVKPRKTPSKSVRGRSRPSRRGDVCRGCCL